MKISAATQYIGHGGSCRHAKLNLAANAPVATATWRWGVIKPPWRLFVLRFQLFSSSFLFFLHFYCCEPFVCPPSGPNSILSKFVATKSRDSTILRNLKKIHHLGMHSFVIFFQLLRLSLSNYYESQHNGIIVLFYCRSMLPFDLAWIFFGFFYIYC